MKAAPQGPAAGRFCTWGVPAWAELAAEMSMEDRTAMMEFAAVGPTSPTSTTTIANYLGELFPTRATAAGDEGGTPQQTPVQCMASLGVPPLLWAGQV